MKRVITYGTFDLLHYGHINLLKRAKALGDYLVVAPSTDEFNAIKGKTSFFKYEQRKALLEAIRYVDLVIPENEWEQKKSDVHEYHIDIFPYDSVSDDEKLAHQHACDAKKIKDKLYYKSKRGASSLIKRIVLPLYQLALLPYSSNKLAYKLDKMAQKFNEKEPKSKYVTNLMGAYSYEKEKVLRENIGQPVNMDFDGLQIKVPAKCAEFLKDVYGPNFMTPADIRLDMNQYYALVEKDFKI